MYFNITSNFIKNIIFNTYVCFDKYSYIVYIHLYIYFFLIYDLDMYVCLSICFDRSSFIYKYNQYVFL